MTEELEAVSVPPSREVRLQDGVTEGYLEDLLFRAHTGPTSDLVKLIAQAELQVQYLRSKAVGELGALLLSKLTANHSSIGALDVADTLREWRENEVLDIPQLPEAQVEIDAQD